MKKSTLLKCASFSIILEKNKPKIVEKESYLSEKIEQNSIYSTLLHLNFKHRISNMLIIGLFMLIFNSVSAQKVPACNITGPLKVALNIPNENENPTNILTNNQVVASVFKSEVINTNEQTVYLWSFKTNQTQASFTSRNGRREINVHPGSTRGNYTVELKLINTAENGTQTTCTCTQSVTVY